MSSEIAVTLTLIAASGILIWILRAPAPGQGSGIILRDEIDYDELADAEREVRDLDAFASPEEADEELRDWGPGAPQ